MYLSFLINYVLVLLSQEYRVIIERKNINPARESNLLIIMFYFSKHHRILSTHCVADGKVEELCS